MNKHESKQMNTINQINAMTNERREEFVKFLNSMFIEHIDIEMFNAEEEYTYYQIDFDYVDSMENMIDNMNDEIADFDEDKTWLKFIKTVCDDLENYQEFINLLNNCDDVDTLKQYIDYDAANVKFEQMRILLLKK